MKGYPFTAFRRRAGAQLAAALPTAEILVYHRVAPEDGPDPWGLRLSPERFEQQLAWLADQGWVRPLSDLFGPQPGSARRVALTFDDGYLDNLTWAAPLLQRYDLPATFFLPTGEGRSHWWDQLPPDHSPELYARLQRSTPAQRARVLAASPTRTAPARLERAQILELARLPGVEIGAHSVTHPRLDQLRREAVRTELTESRAALEQLIQRPVLRLAYPHGVPPRWLDLVAEAGFRAAYVVADEPAWPYDHPFLIPRRTVGNWSADEFARRVLEWRP